MVPLVGFWSDGVGGRVGRRRVLPLRIPVGRRSIVSGVHGDGSVRKSAGACEQSRMRPSESRLISLKLANAQLCIPTHTRV